MGAPTSRSSRCAPPHAPPTRTSSCCACRMAIRRCWGSGVRGCRGANASASPLRGRCCAIRRCSSSTKRRAPSIPSRSGWCRRRSNASWRTGPCSSSPTAWPRCSTPTSSWCWPRDASWSAAATTTCSPPTASIGASTTCNSGPDMLSGFTIVRNAVKLDFPIVPAIRSVLAVCDEVVVNVGKSEDDTRDLVASIGDPRVRILDTEWDFTKKNIMLSIETQRAMDACRGSWGIYIQADEVLHERSAQILKEKLEISKTIYPWSAERSEREQARGFLEWTPLLRHFTGAHPAAVREWIAERSHDPERVIGPVHFKPEHLRFYVSDWVERLTGARVFEFRNYVIV